MNTKSDININGPSRGQRRIVLALAIVILSFSMYGFVEKFVQFVIVLYGEPDGTFALTPIINYLLASFGFLFLLGWAAANGMFHDIERPKYTMLEIEQQLDAREQRNTHATSKESTI